VRRYTDKIARIVHLRESDIGRPLTELASTLIYPQLFVKSDREERVRPPSAKLRCDMKRVECTRW